MFLIPAFKSNDYNMNLLYIVTGDKWLKNDAACIFFVPNWVRFSNPQRLTYTQILSEKPPPPLPNFLETRWLVVNEQEDDSVIFQTNPFTNQSMVARKSGN